MSLASYACRSGSYVEEMLRNQNPLIKLGDLFPDVPLVRFNDGKPQIYKTITAISANVPPAFESRTIVLFGVPGAFTPTCSKLHLSGFAKVAQAFQERKTALFCHAPNSVDVVHAWIKMHDESGYIQALADEGRDLTSALGIGIDKHSRGLGFVPSRYAMILEQSGPSKYIVKHLALEQDAGQCGITSAETILREIDKLFSAVKKD